MEDKTYFELPNNKKLILEHVFYYMDEPVLFICRDSKKEMFLCSCCKLGEEWIIGQVIRNDLSDLVSDSITIREMFERRSSEKWFVTWNGEHFSYSTVIPEDVLPLEGAFLELSYEKDGMYKEG